MLPNGKVSVQEIQNSLKPPFKSAQIILLTETDSTNEQLKKYARKDQSEITILIAESQTNGKGTKGRSFYSPDSTGCYMSFLLRPSYSVESCTLLTTAAAAATAEAIEKTTAKKTGIKWVNDIILDGRKVAGILTESSIKKDLSGLDWAVVGIGVNITSPKNGFPDEIRDIAGAITENDSAEFKTRLISEIINRFLSYYITLEKKTFFDSYKSRLFFLGKEVTVTSAQGSYKATAVDIDPMCRLTVLTPDGKSETLHSGEISVKLS